jgi:F-type H+-transporting ATPase subunit gamma
MPSLRDLRRRIRSVKNTEKITKAMELVAAAKMRRAQERLSAARPYADEMNGLIRELMRRSPEYKHPFLTVREGNRRGVILITADRGLAGALNSNNIRLALREMAASDGDASVVCIGRKARDSMRRLHKKMVAEVSNYGDAPRFIDILPAVQVALDLYTNDEVDRIDVVVAEFLSAGRQQAVSRPLLPLTAPPDAPKAAADFEYEPEPGDVLDLLLPRHIEAQVYRAVLENIASEQASRMRAMHNASENAADFIADLTLTANKVRQSTITTELMEIVGGSVALEG